MASLQRSRIDAGLAGILAVCAVMLGGCHLPETSNRRSRVESQIARRADHSLAPLVCAGELLVPATVIVEDGVDEEEAIALALWNNAAFQELLTQLGISQAQAIEAGLLTDPQFTILFPVGPKQMEFTALVALEALYLRPIRVRAAELDLDRTADQMVQGGLNLVRDTRVAYANLLLAQQRASLAHDALDLRTDIADLTERRLRAGDISELESATARTDAIQARVDSSRFDQNVFIAAEQLRALTGLGLIDVDMIAWETPLSPSPIDAHPDDLVHEALAFRPDLRAAELAIQAAGERAGLERKSCMTIAGILDANEKGIEGFEIGPGLQMTIPVFNGNRGQIALADANLQQAMRAYITVRDRIALEVRTAYYQAQQAQLNLAVVEQELLPTLDQTVTLARANYERGAVPYFLVLQTTAQYLDARTRHIDLGAEMRRTVAELERSVGHRFLTNPLHAEIGSPLAPGFEGEELESETGDEHPILDTDVNDE